MALPASWNTKQVFGTWLNYDGTKKAGQYVVTIPARVTNTPSDVILPAGTFASGNLSTSSTSFDMQLPCTDDPDNTPVGWQIIITITFTDGSAKEVYQIDIPTAASSVDLRTVIIPTLVADPLPTLVRGVAGGVAGLNASGQVIDATGSPVTGGTGGDVTSDQITDSTATGRSVLVATTKTAARTAIDAADVAATVNLTGNQTVAGTKTYSSAPVVPDGSFTNAKTTGLQAALDAKAAIASISAAGFSGDAVDLLNLATTVIDVVSGQVARVGLCIMVGYNDAGSAWPTVPSSLLTDANIGIHWLGADVSHAPVSSSGPAAWDYPA